MGDLFQFSQSSGQVAYMHTTLMRQKKQKALLLFVSSVPQIISKLALKFKVVGDNMDIGYGKLWLLEYYFGLVNSIFLEISF